MEHHKSLLSEEDITSMEAMLDKATVTFPLQNSWYNPAFYLGDGGTMFGESHADADAGVNFDIPDVTEYLVELVANKNFKTDADGSGFAAFTEGKAATLFSGSWDYDNLKNALGDDLGAAKLPTFEVNGETKQMLAFSGSKAIGVNPHASNQAAAVQFAAYLGSEEAQKAHWEDRSVIPCNTELLKDPEIGDNMLVKAQNDTINETSFVQPTISAMGNFWGIMEAFGKNLTNKDITLDNAVEQTTKLQEQLTSELK